MNRIEFRKETSNNIIFINNIPFLLKNSPAQIERIQTKGKLKTAFYDKLTFVKLEGDVCTLKNELDHKSYMHENHIKGVLGSAHNIYLLDGKDKKIKVYELYSTKQRSSPNEIIDTKFNVKNVYHGAVPNVAIVETEKGSFHIWKITSSRLYTDTHKIEETPIGHKLYGYKSAEDILQSIKTSTHVALTNKGFFVLGHSMRESDVNIKPTKASSAFHQKIKDHERFCISLPENIKQEDIKDFQILPEHNIFILTNSGEVYSIGSNRYGERGTTKKLDSLTWNKIKYPEPIKQIEVAPHKPGVFALSESGNLYYHGYNEEGYYPITGKKSSISRPVKIAENIDNIFFPISRYTPSATSTYERHLQTLCAFDKEGIPKLVINNRIAGHSIKNKLVFNTKFYEAIRTAIHHTKPLIQEVLRNYCK